MSKNPESSLPPGFRFHPTDEELILHYLKNKATSTPCPVSIIAEVDIYKFDPWDLPVQAAFGEKEWYFFTPRDRKYPNGARPNRAAASGYWKATGTDKPILSTVGKENIGVKKALVFYKGRPPKGVKTNWIMHEYRLAEAPNISKPIRMKESSMRLDDWVLCRIYKKNIPLPMTSTMNREQEDHSFEDQSVATFPNITNQSAFELPKSSSFSDLLAFTDFSVLSRLLADNPSDSVGSEPGPFYTNANLNQPMVSSSSSYLHQKLPQQELSALSSENQLKRQRPMALSSDEVVLHHTSKKFNNNSCNFTNITNQLDTPQYNLLNQSFFNQQILLNSQLEF